MSDSSDGSGSKDFVAWAQGVIDQWGEWLAEMLGVPQRQVKGIEMVDMDHPAETSDDVIRLDPDWFRAHPGDRGAILHELTHVYTSGTTASSKRNEALADVARYRLGMGYAGWQPNELTVKLANLPPDQLQGRVSQWLSAADDKPLMDLVSAPFRSDAEYQGTAPPTPTPTATSGGYGPSPIPVKPPPTPDPQGEGPDYVINWDKDGPNAGKPYKDYGQVDTPQEAQAFGNMANERQDLGEWMYNLSQSEVEALPPADVIAWMKEHGENTGAGASGHNPLSWREQWKKLQEENKQKADKTSPKTPYAPFGWLEPTRRQGMEDYLTQSADMYFQIWGVPPPPGYLENQIKSGLNFYEMFDAERAKPAFKHTSYYRDQYASVTQQVSQALGMRP